MMTKKAQFLVDRNSGMSYQEIADKHGVSRQYVAQICSKYEPSQFRFIKEKSCIYPNWRKWMNEERCSRLELLRRMGIEPIPDKSLTLSGYMRGATQPRKPYIDKLLEATGMTYEVMFAMEDE